MNADAKYDGHPLSVIAGRFGVAAADRSNRGYLIHKGVLHIKEVCYEIDYLLD